MAILDARGNQDPADIGVRLHRGLLAYASTAGLDDAYDLLHDGDRQQAMIADSAIAGETRLAIARMHSALVNDDPEAHFQLATLVLLAILTKADPSGSDVAPALVREAAAVLADCAANAAPYEQRDYARRLAQLTAAHPPLAPYLPELQKQLITGGGGPDPSQLRCRSSASRPWYSRVDAMALRPVGLGCPWSTVRVWLALARLPAGQDLIFWQTGYLHVSLQIYLACTSGGSRGGLSGCLRGILESAAVPRLNLPYARRRRSPRECRHCGTDQAARRAEFHGDRNLGSSLTAHLPVVIALRNYPWKTLRDWSRPIDPNCTRGSGPQHPTAEQAGSEHGPGNRDKPGA